MKLRIAIKGRVHDVGYRLFLLELADSLLIDKFDARNVKINGKQAVVVLVDGDEKQLKEFVEVVKSEKPEMAVVESIEIEEYEGRVKDIERFRSGFNTAQLSKIVQVGLKMLERQGETIKEIRNVGEKVDGVSKKLDRTNELLEQRFERLEEEIERIKRALVKHGIEV